MRTALQRGGLALSLLGALAFTTGAAAGPAGGATSGSAACGTAQPLRAAQSGSTTGITPDAVRVGNVSILTGPVPGLFKGAPTGARAYFAYVNAHGGVDGRRIQLDSYDDGFSGSQNTAETQTAVGRDFALVGNFSLYDSYGCKVLAQNPAVPDVSMTLDPGTSALPNEFSIQPVVPGMSTGPVQYLKQRYPHDLKVGAIVANVGTSTTAWAGERAALEHLGYHISYVDLVNPLQTDFTTDVINMRNKGVNFLWMGSSDWQDEAVLMQNMTQQGWRPPVLFSDGPVYADQFIKAAGGASVADGVWVGQDYPLYLGQDARVVPAVKTFDTWVHKVDPTWIPDLYTLYGWASAQLFVQALRAAGPHPTRGSVLAALHKIDSFSPSGLVATSNPAQKKPPICFVMARIEHGNFVRVSPAGGGFDCSGTYFAAPSG
jgi:ABC-type branched-subunit amino acid transport system substrate-binding protein